MKNKILSLSVLIFSIFLFSACTLGSQKQNQQITPVPTKINQETGNDTEAELQQQLNADQDIDFDSDLNSLQAELDK
jgi:predicted PurR-regulated permease PerM